MPKRALFSGVQASQTMAIEEYQVLPIRTSYDRVIGKRCSDLYVSTAKRKGTVTGIEDEGIEITYDDGTIERFNLGLYYGKGAGEYHKHEKITDLKIGDKVKAGEDVAWDRMFFDKDPLTKTAIIKNGTLVRTALMEVDATFEDSILIVEEFAKKCTTPFIKPNKFKVYKNQAIKLYCKIGDRVEYGQILCDREDVSVSDIDYDDADNFSGLDRFGVDQIKADNSGIITKIDVLYNGEIEDFHPTVGKLIKQNNVKRAKMAKYNKNTSSTGNVGGNTSIGQPDLYPGTVSVVIYIEEKLKTTTADKLANGNQMKGTVGAIYQHTMHTEDGRPVLTGFSVKSIFARMVLSAPEMFYFYEYNNVRTHRIIKEIEGETTWSI